MQLTKLFTFGFVFLFCLTLASCELNINPAKFKANVDDPQITINFPSFSNYLHIYSTIDNENPIETISLGCEEECSGEISFSYNFPDYASGKYNLRLFVGGEWVTTYFEIVSDEGDTGTCFDSDAETENPYEVYGYVTTDNIYLNYDICEDEDILQEAECNLGNIIYEYYECERGCEDGMCEKTPTICEDGTLISTCSATKPFYCDEGGELIPDCVSCGCLNNRNCQEDGSCSFKEISRGDIPPVGVNKKAMSLYSDKETFLTSDKDWKSVLPFVSATTWTQQEEDTSECQRGYGTPADVCVYPTLIYHEDYLKSITHDSLILEEEIYNGQYKMEGGIMVYTGAEGLYTYNLSTSEKTLITSNQWGDIFAVSNAKVVWLEITEMGDDFSWRLFLYDISSEEINELPLELNYPSSLSFSGGNIAWEEEVGTRDVGGGRYRTIQDIHLYDIQTNIEKVLASNIESSGLTLSNQYLVWTSIGLEDTYYLNFYDYSTQQINSIPESAYPFSLSISGNILAFQKTFEHAFEIFSYNILTKEEKQITSDGKNNREPLIYENKIVWERDWKDVYSYDLQTEQITAIANSYKIERFPEISNDKIFFCKGEMSCEEGLFVYNSSLNNEEIHTGFDADSIIYFMQQYFPSKLTLVGETPLELDSLLIASPELGAGMTEEKIQRINPNNYLSYWESFDTFVYVQDDYELALLASTYASLLNAPLIIQNSELDKAEVFAGRKIICVGDASPAGAKCSEKYSLEELQKKYKEETKTNKVILINPEDWSVFEDEKLEPEKSDEFNYQLYTKTSLVAPILASVKHELILSTKEADYLKIDTFIKTQLENIEYLTIFAAPNVIPYREIMSEFYDTTYRSLDQTQYADINSDKLPDIATGRVMGISLSDVSSYVARDLFYDIFQKTNNVKFMASSFKDMINQSLVNAAKFEEAGYNSNSINSEEQCYSFLPSEWKNQDLISYSDHGNSNWAGISSYEMPLLKNSVVINNACSTCSNQDGQSFCNIAIRQGAIAHIGAVSIAYTGNFIYAETIDGIYYSNLAVGDAFKTAYLSPNSYDIAYAMTMLLGDPTLYLNPLHMLSGHLCSLHFLEYCNGIDDDCDGAIDEEPLQGCLTYAYDGDGDGYGDSNNWRCLCNSSGKYTALLYYDCDDNNPDVNPGKSEICGNSIDDNCNLVIDETDCSIVPTCTPKSCSELGKTCGEVDDGCGIRINCGECPIEVNTCQLNGAWMPWQADKCCSRKTDGWGFCTPCLTSGTRVNIFDQGNCCNSWKWVTKTSTNFCGWCANGASTCWPWDWRAWWDAEHCGTSEVNDYQVCT